MSTTEYPVPNLTPRGMARLTKDEQVAAMWSPCSTCGVGEGTYCETEHGLRASRMHMSRAKKGRAVAATKEQNDG